MKNKFNIFLIIPVLFLTVTTTIVHAETNDREKQAILLHKILKTLQKTEPDMSLSKNLASIEKSEDGELSEEELLKIAQSALKEVKKYDNLGDSPAYTQLQQFIKSTIKELKNYHITGLGFTSHSSFGLLYNSQDFPVTFSFKDAASTMCNKKFTIKYAEIGLQAELLYRFDALFTIGADLSRHDTLESLKFSPGLTSAGGPGITQFGFTILPFSDHPGCMIILHFGVGLTTPGKIALVLPSGSFAPTYK
ncbi:hypothetical protein FJ364_03065 [Candidatus Dependentiae bacterium]|nr:hypothetical protein [Candidatus Dependentiae bacterium]